MPSHLIPQVVVGWAKDFIPVAAAAGIITTGTVKLIGVETQASHDADMMALRQERIEAIQHLDEHDADNEIRLDRIEMLLQCLLWEVPPSRCVVADPQPPIKDP